VSIDADGSDEMFGPPPDDDEDPGFEGDDGGGSDDSGEAIQSGKIDLGDGVSMMLNPAVIRGLLMTPGALAATVEHANQVADAANTMAQTPGARYGVDVRTEGDRPVAYVKAMNDEAKYDTAAHSTLLIAASSFGSAASTDDGMSA
jgi:hypothetical protein